MIEETKILSKIPKFIEGIDFNIKNGLKTFIPSQRI
jgi:hypothetical protein